MTEQDIEARADVLAGTLTFVVIVVQIVGWLVYDLGWVFVVSVLGLAHLGGVSIRRAVRKEAAESVKEER